MKKVYCFEWMMIWGAIILFLITPFSAFADDKADTTDTQIIFNPIYVTTDGEDYGGENSYKYDSKGFTPGAGFKPTDQTSLEFSTLFTDSDLVMSENTPSLDAGGNLIKNQASSEKHRESLLYQLGLAWSHAVTHVWDYTLKGSYGATERHYFWSKTVWGPVQL